MAFSKRIKKEHFLIYVLPKVCIKIELIWIFYYFMVVKLFWLMVLFGSDVMYLYIGRIFAGSTGGGMYICLPLFVAEIADQRWVHRVSTFGMPHTFANANICVHIYRLSWRYAF